MLTEPDKLDCAAPPPGAPAAPPSNPTLPPALANIKLDPTAFSKWHIEMTEKLNQRRVQMQAQPSKYVNAFFSNGNIPSF